MAQSALPSSALRTDAVRQAERELEAWCARAIPDRSAPLDADDVARLVRDCLHALALDHVAADFSVNTVHYYRRKDILDAPEGRTSAARYGLRHLWQAVGARLAGQLGLLTLAEAREAMHDESEEVLAAFVAERVADARARHAVRRASVTALDARPLVSSLRPTATASVVPDSRRIATPDLATQPGIPSVVFQLPEGAWCVLPAAHPARHSAEGARALARALVDALRSDPHQKPES